MDSKNEMTPQLSNDSVDAKMPNQEEPLHPRVNGPIHAERTMKIICIGAGASGLLLAYKLQRSFGNFELVVYEKNEDIGGTWFENRYPGCACDIPSHTYTWSFEPNLDWTSVYATAPEIHKYFTSFATKYSLQKYIRLGSKVTDATWDATSNTWIVEITDVATGKTYVDNADILVNASGILNTWKWPSIEGLESYKGTLMHTANYDQSVDLTGKTVGVIGNGSTGVQVIPTIQPQVRKLKAFSRHPTWISTASFEQHVYTPSEREHFASDPTALLDLRKEQETIMNSMYPMFIAGSTTQESIRSYLVAQMHEKMEGVDQQTQDTLVPNFGVGCRRITPGVGYLESLGKENVEVVYGDIERITEKGCVVGGKEHQIDVLICATGFEATYMPRFGVKGEGGRSIKEEWANEIQAYLGVAVAGFPNYFLLAGPNSPFGNGPILSCIESQVDYILKLANRWQTENIKSFTPKREAVQDFNAHKDSFMETTVWVEKCPSWYKANSESGKVTGVWAGSSLHYIEAIAEPRYEDWEIKYEGNRFAWLGNGFSQTEVDMTADWAYYLKTHDDSPLLGRQKALQAKNGSGTVSRTGIRGFVAVD